MGKHHGRIAVVPRPVPFSITANFTRSLQDELFHTLAFRAWLTAISSPLSLRHAMQASSTAFLLPCKRKIKLALRYCRKLPPCPRTEKLGRKHI
jgi:hypothetical protein